MRSALRKREFPPLDRRRWLQVAGVGWLGSALGGLNQALGESSGQAAHDKVRRPIQSCIVLFHYGGPSQFETYDPKPDAPQGIRGEYGTISTAVPGVNIGEYLPRVATIMGRLTVVRSMHHPMRNHNAAAAEVFTGRTPAGGDLELLADEARSFPTLGSSVSFGLGERAHVLPYVALPYTIFNVVQLPGQTPGFLGGAYDRFQVTGDPNSANFRIAALEPPVGRPALDVDGRRQLLQEIDQLPAAGGTAKMRTYQQRALELISSDAVRRSFDLAKEDVRLRDRYGRHRLGQSLLLARRLVEGGVNFVTVFDGRTNGQDANWDSHLNLFPRHKQLIPPADEGFSALIEDLADRGLLESTLVVVMAEFGRTPKINGNAGRDHWPDCYSIVLAGGGLRGGVVYGASDKIGAYPDRDPVTPADLAATIFWRFGIDPALEMRDPTNRPFRLSDGQPLTSLFG
ncbi:MAG TPA: DUF1501 domain-containing protein [Pirellulales bacterium]|nr:DUF1501 domain-containing protein [Pirellulales bacterium]